MNKGQTIISAFLGFTLTSASAEQDSSPIIVIEGKKIEQLNLSEVKSADVAEALHKTSPSVSLVRRSGIANDIILRGQKKDNINVLIDDAKIHGACPNRMDPPTSHILSNNIDEIEIIKGPFDVENFGTLSGAVKVKTIVPEPGFSGNVDLNIGSWDYEKFAATLQGGNEKFRALLSFSQETGGQYEDGDGQNFSEQIESSIPGTMANYKPEYQDLDAFEKGTVMAKVYAFVADNQELDFGYTANRSDDVLYPSSKMDALYDDSDLFNVNYRVFSFGDWSDKFEIKAYHSSVEHPMSNFYRMSSGPGSANERISYLETEAQGIKLINETSFDNGDKLKVGLDMSQRNWDGAYEGKGTSAVITGIPSIPDVDTENTAVFIEYDQVLSDAVNLKLGARLDDTEVTTGDTSLNSNNYDNIGAFVAANYRLADGHKLFIGLGSSSRAPDARELYFRSAMMGGMLIGNPDLKDTVNTELDFGVQSHVGMFSIDARIFYSQLKDFIHYNDSKSMRRFDNVDASIYGLELTGGYEINPALDLEFGLASQRGEKDEPLTGQTDRDLAEIPPLKINMGLNYHYQSHGTASLEVVASDDWDRFDSDNGEQKLDSWSVVNLKVQHRFNKQLGLTFGIDNLLDETYAISNTYKDLILLTDGSGEVMLMNEPGRYVYLNGTYSF